MSVIAKAAYSLRKRRNAVTNLPEVEEIDSSRLQQMHLKTVFLKKHPIFEIRLRKATHVWTRPSPEDTFDYCKVKYIDDDAGVVQVYSPLYYNFSVEYYKIFFKEPKQRDVDRRVKEMFTLVL